MATSSSRHLVALTPRDSPGHVLPLMRHISKLFDKNKGPFGVTVYTHSDGYDNALRLRNMVFPDTVGASCAEIVSIAPNEYQHPIIGNSVDKRTTTQHLYFHNAIEKIYVAKHPPTMLMIDEWIGGDARMVDIFKAKYPNCPVLLFLTHPAAWTLRQYGLERHGGLGQTAELTMRHMANNKLPNTNAENPLKCGTVLKLALNYQERNTFHTEGDYRSKNVLPLIPSKPQMTHADLYPDYEHMDEEAGIKFTDQLFERQDLLKACHGVITCSVPELEPAGYERMSLSIGKPAFWIGPQFALPSDTQASIEAEAALSRAEPSLSTFLRARGERSVILVASGSHHGFTEVHRTILYRAIKAALQDPSFGYDFLIAVNTNTVQKGDRLSHFFAGSSRVHVHNGWFEQAPLLHTRKFAYFLSHGGFGSVIESLLSLTPLVIWPFVADQPALAILLAQNPDSLENCAIRINPTALNRALLEQNKISIDTETIILEQYLVHCFLQMSITQKRHQTAASKLGNIIKAYMSGHANHNIERLLAMSDPHSKLDTPHFQVPTGVLLYRVGHDQQTQNPVYALEQKVHGSNREIHSKPVYDQHGMLYNGAYHLSNARGNLHISPGPLSR